MSARSAGPAARALARYFESCHLAAYPDPATGGAPWTIGWGATGFGIRAGVVWTQGQADARLEADLAMFGREVAKLIGSAPTTQNQFDALVDFAYNEGAGHLQHSTLLNRHNAGDHATAQAQFLLWNKAGGHVMGGLTHRRAAEAAIYAAPDGADIAHIIQQSAGGR